MLSRYGVWVVLGWSLLALAACGDDEDQDGDTPMCSATTQTGCICADVGAACTSQVECCSNGCDYSTGTCGTASPCNPVTFEPCNVAGGDICSGDDTAGWFCLFDPDRNPLCGACGEVGECEARTGCLATIAGGVCARFCCDDGDCGGGYCGTWAASETVGVCVEEQFSDTVQCDVPATPPSQGSCHAP